MLLTDAARANVGLLHLQLDHPLKLDPMYIFFNYYDAVATFAAVKARYCPAPPAAAPMDLDQGGGLRKKSRRTRRNVRVKRNKKQSRNNKTNKHRKL
jgi:hypothetical protein